MTLLRRLAPFLSVLAPAVLAGQPASVPVEIAVHARAVAPGEPLRVEVRSPVPLEELHGTFRKRRIAFVRAEGAAPAETWWGWTLVGLDDPAGAALLDVGGRAVGGRHVVGTLAVTIEPREFPVERLQVARKYVEPPAGVTARLARERTALDAIYERATPPPERLGPFVPPVPGRPTSIFGKRRIFNGKPRSPHPGLDLRAAVGDPVVAAGPGTVVWAAELYYSGNTVIVDHGLGLFTLYAHLSQIDVASGDRVEPGTPLGRAGATGRVTGPHLHFGAKIGREPFDPRALYDPSLFR